VVPDTAESMFNHSHSTAHCSHVCREPHATTRHIAPRQASAILAHDRSFHSLGAVRIVLPVLSLLWSAGLQTRCAFLRPKFHPRGMLSRPLRMQGHPSSRVDPNAVTHQVMSEGTRDLVASVSKPVSPARCYQDEWPESSQSSNTAPLQL